MWRMPSSICSGAVAPGGCCLKGIQGVSTLAGTVYYHFRKWRLDGRLRQAHERLRAERCASRKVTTPIPSGAVIDSQALKGSGLGGPERGYDGAKRLSGSRRQLLVDTGGLVFGARVHGASVHDRDGGRRLLEEGLAEELPRLAVVWADAAYTRVGSRELGARGARLAGGGT
jgi:putative transposase